jgi:hypothetical protein
MAKRASSLVRLPARHALSSIFRREGASESGSLLAVNICLLLSKTFYHIDTCFRDSVRSP